MPDDAAGIDDQRDAPRLVDRREDREAHRLVAVARSDLVPVVGCCGEHDRAVGGERLFERGELEHLEGACAESDDDPGPAIGLQRDAAPPLAADERVRFERRSCCSDRSDHVSEATSARAACRPRMG